MNKERLNGQMSMFEIAEEDDQWVRLHDDLPELPAPPPRERLNMEKEALGLYISGHPLEEYVDVLQRYPGLLNAEQLKEAPDNINVVAAGMISSLKTIITKTGKPMSFFMLEDLTGTSEVVVFSLIHEKAKEFLVNDNVVIVHGRTSHKEEEDVKIMSENILLLPREAREVIIRCGEDESLSKLLSLKEMLAGLRGTLPVYLYFPLAEKKVLLGQDFWLYDEAPQLLEIERLFGDGAVTISKAG